MRKLIFAAMIVAGTVLAVGAVFAAGSGLATETTLNTDHGPLSLILVAETGFVKVFAHTITIGDPSAGNTPFDYVAEGGQEILFPFNRFSAELDIGGRHDVIFLYQPLVLSTQVRLVDPRTIDGVTFAADDGLNVTYSFPFYRVSYLFDTIAADEIELAVGASLQLRNASVRFESTDGTRIVVSQDLGLVPILKIRGEYRFRGDTIPGGFVGVEADGFYASSAFFNGADFDFTGSIFDASLRAGFQPIPGVEAFVNVRMLGGGATGTRPAEDNVFWTQSRSGYTDNSLTTLTVTLGARLR